MDNVLYLYRKASVDMLRGAEYSYPAPVSVVTEYLISVSGFPISRGGRRSLIASWSHYIHFPAELIEPRIGHQKWRHLYY